ncbi:MAG: fructosamine kinase family protein [Burkholderiales bacterium]|nr:fructosamine kinase family protein [Phycisphaerae bacterium]
MVGGDDISWQELGRITREWAGDAAELTALLPLSGGSINNTLMLVTADDRKSVLKITPHRVNVQLEVEAFQLTLLRDLGLPVPAVYQCHVASLDNPNSYLLLEYCEGITLTEAKRRLAPEVYDGIQQQLAELTARLHQHTRENYGKVDASGNHQTPHWAGFYRSLHEHSLQIAQQMTEIPIKVRKKLEKLHRRLEQFLAHGDQPRLCHGDLWGGNVICRQDADGQWRITAIIDPNLRYGHAESELAYMDLFETSAAAFRRTYQQSHKLDEDYHRVRKPIYQLYPLINNVQLFGAKYVPALVKVAERATSFV